eukprot:GHVU01043722.1.p1 GENE.GHVU01043722.1~~GHVU01043722.1.p1  ORF type:complete len:628 (-),score=44.35 GHVU01043722.1:909-2576(-)
MWYARSNNPNNQAPQVDWFAPSHSAKIGKFPDLRALLHPFAKERKVRYDRLVRRFTEFMSGLIAGTIKATRDFEKKTLFHSAKSCHPIPIIFHSTAGVTDVPLRHREWCHLALRQAINAFPEEEKDEQVATRIVTTPEWASPITGQEEAIYSWMAKNAQTGTLRKMFVNPMAELTDHLVAIVEVGGASMQAAFPVGADRDAGPLQTVDLTYQDRYLPGEKFKGHLRVVATSFMNLGIIRASSLLLKQLCEDPQYVKNGVCRNPCMHPNWRQQCHPSPPIERNKTVVVKDGVVQVSHEFKDNQLGESALYCHYLTPEVNLTYGARQECLGANFDIYEDDAAKRASIRNCTEVVGVGDFEQCSDAITRFLLTKELPANRHAEVVGSSDLFEFGRFVRPKHNIYFVGGAMAFPVKELTDWGFLQTHPVRGVFPNFAKAARVFCKIGITDDQTHFDHPKVPNWFQLSEMTYDYCFKLSLAYNILTAIGVDAVKGPNVYFDFPTGGNAPSGWRLGSLIEKVSSKNFAHQAWTLGARHFRRVAKRSKPFVYDRVALWTEQK